MTVTSRTHFVGQLQQPGSKPQNVEFIAKERANISSDERAAGIGWVDSRYDEPYPPRYGGIADNSTDSLVAIQNACKVSAQSGKAVVIDGPYFVDINDENDPLELLSGVHIRFTEKGSIRWDFFGLPCMFANEQDGITIEEPHIIYDATVATSLPAATATFQNALSGTQNFPDRDVITAIGLYGVDNVTITNPRFTNTAVAWDTVHNSCIVISDHGDRAKSKNVRILGDMYIEAAHMGIIAWGVDQIQVGNIYSDQFTEFDTGTYPWNAAGHPIYITNAQSNTNVVIGDVYDEGVELTGGPAHTLGSDTMHFRDIDGFRHGAITSFNDYGYGDYTKVKNANCGDIWWKGTDATKKSFTGAAMRFLPNVTGSPVAQEFQDIHFGNVLFHMPDADERAIDDSGGDANFIERMTIDNLFVFIDGTALSSPLIIMSSSDSKINMTLVSPDMQSNQVIWRIDDDGQRNHLDLHVIDGPFSTMRPMVKDGSALNTDKENSFIVTHNTGKREGTIHTELQTTHVSEVVTATSGATVTATNLIPDGAFVIGVTTMITTALGTGNGTTGYGVGDGSDPNRWGDVTTTVKNGGSGNKDWTAGGNAHFTSAQTITLTAAGGNFDGTGAIRIGVSYMIGTEFVGLQGG